MNLLQNWKRMVRRLLFLWMPEDELFYIGGAEVLPPPLEKEEERRCLEALILEEQGRQVVIRLQRGTTENAAGRTGDGGQATGEQSAKTLSAGGWEVLPKEAKPQAGAEPEVQLKEAKPQAGAEPGVQLKEAEPQAGAEPEAKRRKAKSQLTEGWEVLREAKPQPGLENGPLTAEDARKRLISHNLRLVVYLAKRFENTGINVEDLISIGTIGLIKGINTFNPMKKIKLATYASRCIENEILMYLRRSSKNRLEVSIDEPLNVDWDGNELLLSDILGTDEDVISRDMENQAELVLLRKALSILNDREKEIIVLRYGLNHPEGREMTQKEVADRLGISQSYISRLEKKIMLRLRREIEKYE